PHRPTLTPYTTLFRSENTPDSVFCDHGAGYIVKWDQVKAHMHLDSGLDLGEPEEDSAPAAPPPPRKGSVYSGSLEGDDELMAILDRKSTRLNSSHVSI